MTRPTTLWTRVLRGAVGVGVTGGAVLVSWTPPAVAAPLVSFRAVASADGVRQTVTRPDAPLSSQVVDSALPSAQASLDGLGNSEAYGSFVYPGDTAITVPGLLSGAAGTSLPSYPLLASSSDPVRPESDASQGPVVIKASSTPTRSTGLSSSEVPEAVVAKLLATADVTADKAAGRLTALAKGEATAIDVAGVLRISSVRSQAKAQLVSGAVTSSSSLEVGDLHVAGVRMVLTDKGLVLPGQTVPQPDASAVTQPLTDAGVRVDLLKPEKLVGGVRAGGVRISVVASTPDGSSVTQMLVFGQALALVAATSDQSTTAEPPPTISEPPSEQTGGSTPPAIGGGGGGGVGGVSPGLPSPTDDQVPAPQTVATPAADPPVNAVNAVPVSLGSVPFARMDTLSFYLILVLAGGVALAAQKALRRFGVSSTWTS
jgi:hypothetical protein